MVPQGFHQRALVAGAYVEVHGVDLGITRRTIDMVNASVSAGEYDMGLVICGLVICGLNTAYVHTLRAGAGLPDSQREFVVMLSCQYFIRRLTNGARFLFRQQAKIMIRPII